MCLFLLVKGFQAWYNLRREGQEAQRILSFSARKYTTCCGAAQQNQVLGRVRRSGIERLVSMNLREQKGGTPRWRYLGLAVLVFVLTGLLVAVVWQIPRLMPGLFPPWGGQGGDTPTPSVLAPTASPVVATPTPSVLEPTASPMVATATPSVLEPTITDLSATVDDQAEAITFYLEAAVPPERQIEEILLWYDTETGHQLQRMVGPLSSQAVISYTLDADHEGLTRTLTTTNELDYWWLVRDTSGESVRLGGIAALGPNLWSSVTTPTPEPPPVEFTWSVSDSRHYAFQYAPDTAAERDRFRLGAVAEASLVEIRSILDVEFDDQMKVYLVPRVFWQGGAAYGDKVQLISYLDRNYTSIETWSYFTHEGTHALAQDLLQPKENGGGPDGVLVEGLAVWASDGHYRREPIDDWAAVVAASDEYLPLAELRAGPFYDFQHETAYLESASFVKFLIEHYGLDQFKELYGQANGDAAQDEALVERLYGKGYSALEDEWRKYLAGLAPSPEEVEAWHFRVRAFDLMRRYETELDPDARLLPDKAPPEWTSDTLKIFLNRVEVPVNVVLETALIAAQERMHGGDPDGAVSLLDDVEAALDADGKLTQPSLTARQAILAVVAAQDRAVLRADPGAYLNTVGPASGLARDEEVQETLQPPFVAYEQELVHLDLSGDGLRAEGAVLVHAQVAEGEFPEDEPLFAVTFVQVDGQWLMSSREPMESVLFFPAADAD